MRTTTRAVAWVKEAPFGVDLEGTWTVTADADGSLDLPPPGGDPTTFADALDCDLGLSPMTNLMPVHRHALMSGGGPVELVTAWVSVPDLSVQADSQRYAFVRAERDRRVIRYEATDGSFAADIVLDQDGIVIDYPGIARRL